MKRVPFRRPLVVAAIFLAFLPLSHGPLTGTAGGLDAQPNILLIVADDLTMDMLEQLPALTGLDNLVTFNRAYENVPLCCPTRATILSGQYSHHTGVQWNGGDDMGGKAFNESQTLATWLSGAGYETSFYGKYFASYPFDTGSGGHANYVPPGWSRWHAFKYYSNPFVPPDTDGSYYTYDLIKDQDGAAVSSTPQPGTVITRGSAETDYSTDVLAARVRSAMTTAEEPFFTVYSPFAPHNPRKPPLRYVGVVPSTPPGLAQKPNLKEGTLTGDSLEDKPPWIRALSKPDYTAQLTDRKNGYRTVMALNEAIQSFVTTLTDPAVNKFDNTVMIFMSDNGYSYGEHRHIGKQCVYQECVRTPLLVRYPPSASKTEHRLAQSIDIAPTIADLAGVTPSIPVDGVSLVPLLQGSPPTTWRSSVLLQWWPTESTECAGNPTTGPVRPGFTAIVTDDDWKYSMLSTGEVETYDLVNDSYELENLVTTPGTLGQRPPPADLADRWTLKKTEAGLTGSPCG